MFCTTLLQTDKFIRMATDTQTIKTLLHRGVDEVIVFDHLKARLEKGDKLRVKFGIDPTSPHLHLGHTVVLRKLRQFQDAGHQAVLIIGDATAEIGDPTGRSEARKRLTTEEIDENKKTYLEQVSKILDMKTLEVRHNGEWFHKMSVAEFLGLTSLVTVQQVLQREDFKARIDDPEHPLSAIELSYPVMQGYDSVIVKADVELGGVDQKLNVLMGRRLQRKFGQEEQDILTVPLLMGTDGERKMSKSFGNSIALQDDPNEMFAKVMSIPDPQIIPYFELLTEVSFGEIQDMKVAMGDGANPRDFKARLGEEIVKIFYSASDAQAARAEFDQIFKEGALPDDILEVKLDAIMSIVDALVATKLAPSKSEARRLIDGGGVKVNEEVVRDYDFAIDPATKPLLQKGKRFFVRIIY